MFGQNRNKKSVLLSALVILVFAVAIFLPRFGRPKKFPYSGTWSYTGTLPDGDSLQTLITLRNGDCGIQIKDSHGKQQSACSYKMGYESAVINYKLTNLNLINQKSANHHTAIMIEKITPQQNGAVLLLEPISATYIDEKTGKQFQKTYANQKMTMSKIKD